MLWKKVWLTCYFKYILVLTLLYFLFHSICGFIIFISVQDLPPPLIFWVTASEVSPRIKHCSLSTYLLMFAFEVSYLLYVTRQSSELVWSLKQAVHDDDRLVPLSTNPGQQQQQHGWSLDDLRSLHLSTWQFLFSLREHVSTSLLITPAEVVGSWWSLHHKLHPIGLQHYHPTYSPALLLQCH